MAYIGPEPAESFTSFATQEFSTSATTSYTLDHAVANENEIALFVNNVRQQPGSGKAYTATGTALTLSAATASTDTMYCVFLGRALQTVTPATNSITAAMVGNDLISGKTALGAEPADTDEFLVSDAGTLKRVDYSYIKASPGLNFISNTALSSAGSLDINDVFSSTYANYRIIGSGLNMATDNTYWIFQLNNSSGVEGSSYWWAGVGAHSSGSAVDDGDTDSGHWRIITNAASTGQATNFDMTVYRPQAGLYSSYTCIAGGRRSGGVGQVLCTSGYQNSTTSYTGFRISVGSGNISAGNITVFGIKDS